MVEHLGRILEGVERGLLEAERVAICAARAGDAELYDAAIVQLHKWRELLSRVGERIQDLVKARQVRQVALELALFLAARGRFRLRHLRWTYAVGTLGTYLALLLLPVADHPMRRRFVREAPLPARDFVETILTKTVQPTAGPTNA